MSAASARAEAASPLALAVRLGWGAALCIIPGPMLALMGGADEDPLPRRVLRVLGARHIVQAVLERCFGAGARRLGVGVDVLHAATDVGFGVADSRWRRAALTDAVITTGFAVVGVARHD